MTEKNGEGRRPKQVQPFGEAGFSVLESLMLSLMERGVLPRSEIFGLLTDAANAHRHRTAPAADSALHLRVAGLIETLRDGGNTNKRGAWLK